MRKLYFEIQRHWGFVFTFFDFENFKNVEEKFHLSTCDEIITKLLKSATAAGSGGVPL